MCEAFKNELSKGIVDPLILIPCFILDFLCIHPFNDGNGRMSRLLTLLLLYKCGYTVGQYISIEKLLPRPKKAIMTHSLYPIIDGMKPKNDPKEFIKYMLGVILSCYREFENRVGFAWQTELKAPLMTS